MILKLLLSYHFGALAECLTRTFTYQNFAEFDIKAFSEQGSDICEHNQRGIENSKDFCCCWLSVIPVAQKCMPLVIVMCLYLGRTHVRQTYAQTIKDITT
jgi:hypothetical protein